MVRQPGDGVALAAAGRVLDQIAPARAVRGRGGQQLAHHVELVVAGPDLRPPLLARLLILGLDDLGVVLQDVRQAGGGEDALPQVIGLEAVRVGRVACAVVPALVEGQEPRAFALQVRAEAHLVIIDREVDDAAAELKEPLAWLPVALVLLHRIGHGLFGQAVLQLEGGDGQAVDEEAQVEGQGVLIAAVAQLPGDAEAVMRVTLGGGALPGVGVP